MNSRSLSARIWRWNAYVIFVAAILAIAMLVLGFGVMIADELDDQETNVVEVAANRVAQSKTRLAAFEIVPGTNVLRAPLHLDQELRGSVSSKDATSVQNYLFYEPGSASSYWLLDGPAALLASTKPLPSRDYSNERLPVTVFVYEQVPRDTNGDHRLTGADLKTIAVSDAAGRRFSPLVHEVTEMHAAELMTDGTIVILYSTQGKMHAAHVDRATFGVIRTVEVSSQAPSSPRQSPAS